MTMQSPSRLANFPISFFAMVMGLAGLAIAWSKAQSSLQIPVRLDSALVPFTGLVFLVLTILYGLKLTRHRAAVLKELNHPIKLNFFPTFSISMILLAIAAEHLSVGLSHLLWLSGTALHFAFTLYVMNVWIHHDKFEVHHMNPAWFIPVVGNVLVPIAGTNLGYLEISWFSFSLGILFWLVLLTIIFNRMLFHNPLPDKMMPTLFILIAPPAVGFIAYYKLIGELDSFARMLYYSGLFLTLLLLTQISRFRRLQFFLSWWAYSFPLAAITIATLLMYEISGNRSFALLGSVFLAILTLVVVFLFYRTLKAVGAHKVCVPDD
jgi:tellurite resistance protein